VIASGVVWSKATWVPKPALDLAGGTEVVLTAIPQTGTSGKITQETLAEAVNIERQRINGNGVSEAEIFTQGDADIVVSLPGTVDDATLESVKAAAALEFRPVLYEQANQPAATPSPTASGSPGASTSPSPSGSGSATPSATASLKANGGSAGASVSPTPSGNGMAVPKALLAATPTPTPTGSATTGSATPSGSAAASGSPSASAQPSPTDASDMNWINEEVATQFQALDCSKKNNLKGLRSDPKKPLVTCSDDGSASYVLGPVEVSGVDIGGASASLETTTQGATGIHWQVNLEFKNDGPAKFAKVTQRLTTLEAPRNQFAIVLDGLVVSAPRTDEAITGGQARISGSFTQAQAQSLANQLKFGALPISFVVRSQNLISATLGAEQLQRGLLAGVIGLLLVVLYSLAQYRALGFLTVASLIIAGLITYGMVVLLGWRQGYRLSLPGVTGLIVAIGITADSFIVYFERVRDEVRDGRGLQAAVEMAWHRARRTILISDAVSFLAAVVLYILAIGGVRGFAFTLGLTTVVDVLVVFLFTHPMVVLLARTTFFGGGHKLSGFDAEHLGRAVTYTGRGGIRTQPRRTRRPSAAGAAARPAKASAGAGSADKSRPKEPAGLSLGAGSASSGARTGTTIAERRAAAERAEREALLGEPPADGRDDEDTDEEPTRADEAPTRADARTGRRDA
jgi:preprotein translocase subunit SecD